MATQDQVREYRHLARETITKGVPRYKAVDLLVYKFKISDRQAERYYDAARKEVLTTTLNPKDEVFLDYQVSQTLLYLAMGKNEPDLDKANRILNTRIKLRDEYSQYEKAEQSNPESGGLPDSLARAVSEFDPDGDVTAG